MKHLSPTLRSTLKSLMEGQVWVYLLLPIFLTLLVWVALFLFSLDALINMLMESPPLSYMVTWGFLWLAKFLAILSGWIGITSLSYLCSLFFTAILILPFLLKHIAREDYPHLVMAGKTSFTQTVLYSLGIVLLFAFLWILTLPLWFVPGVAFILPFVLMAWLNYKTYAFDILSEFATPSEKTEILKIHGKPLFFLGFLMAVLAHFPFLTMFVPGLAALFFSHYLLLALDDLRNGAVLSVEAEKE